MNVLYGYCPHCCWRGEETTDSDDQEEISSVEKGLKEWHREENPGCLGPINIY